MTVDWKVIAVFDPDHTGHDFAYTVGLHDHGLPELFLWARPTDGDDPGDDWCLSQLDLTHQLNAFGAQLVDGTLAPGASTEVGYDGDATRGRFLLRAPVPARGGGLDAFQTSPHATVSEIRWSLHRTPVGERRALDEAEIRDARSRLALLLDDDLASEATFLPAAVFGPHTAGYQALRAQARAMDENRAYHLIAAVHLGHRPEHEIAVIQQAARRVGLDEPVRRAIELAIADALEIAERSFTDDPDLVRPSTTMFAAILAAAYGVEIAHHAVPADARGASEVLWALLDPGGARTTRFTEAVARADVVLALVLRRPDVDALASTVADLDPETLAGLAGTWTLAAAAGHGSGLWISKSLFRSARDLARFDTICAAGDALAIAGCAALGIRPPADLGAEMTGLADRIAADVKATVLPRAS